MSSDEFNKPLPKPKVTEMNTTAPDGDTNPGYQVDVEYVRRKVGLVADKIQSEMHQELAQKTRIDWVRNIVVAIGAVASTVVAGILLIDSRVQAQTDAGYKVEAAERIALEKRVSTNEQETKQLRAEQYQYRKDTHDDFKELQNVVLTGQRSQRLQQPVPPLDAGR